MAKWEIIEDNKFKKGNGGKAAASRTVPAKRTAVKAAATPNNLTIITPEQKEKAQADYDEAYKWTSDYMNSPMYKKMLTESSANTREFDNIDKTRWSNFKSIPPLQILPQPRNEPNTGGTSLGFNGQVQLFPYGFGAKAIYSHELSHSTDRPVEESDSRIIPQSDKNYISQHVPTTFEDSPMYATNKSFYDLLKKNNPKEYKKEAKDYKKFHINYVGQDTETRARLNAIRQGAQQNNLYDPFKEGVTPELYYDKLKNFKFEKEDKSGADPMYQLKNVYSDEEIIYMLNHISENKKENDGTELNNLPIAKNGLLTKIKSTLNPLNIGVPDYTDKYKTWNEAYSAAKKAGLSEIMWNKGPNPGRKNLDYAGTPAQEMKSYGITGEQRVFNPSTARKNLGRLDTEKGYDTELSQVFKQLFDSKNPAVVNNEEPAYGIEKDAFRLYLGLPQEMNSFTPSKYQKGAFEIVNYNQMLPEVLDENIENLIKTKGNPEKEFKYGEHITGGNSPIKPYGDIVMGKHTVKKGKDDKGEYIEYSDKWDLDSYKVGNVAVGQIADMVNKPLPIYGRVYYKDYGDGVKRKMYYSDNELKSFSTDKNNKNFNALDLQKELVNRGYELPNSMQQDDYGNINFDGIYGNETKQALQDFQSKKTPAPKMAVSLPGQSTALPPELKHGGKVSGWQIIDDIPKAEKGLAVGERKILQRSQTQQPIQEKSVFKPIPITVKPQYKSEGDYLNQVYGEDSGVQLPGQSSILRASQDAKPAYDVAKQDYASYKKDFPNQIKEEQEQKTAEQVIEFLKANPSPGGLMDKVNYIKNLSPADRQIIENSYVGTEDYEGAKREYLKNLTATAVNNPLSKDFWNYENINQKAQGVGANLYVNKLGRVNDLLNVPYMMGEMTPGVVNIPYNLSEGNYGAAAMGLAGPISLALLAPEAKGFFGMANNLLNPLAGIVDANTVRGLSTNLAEKIPLKNAWTEKLINNSENYIKGVQKVIPDLGNLKKNTSTELKKLALSLSPDTAKALGKLDSNISSQMLQKYGWGEWPSVKNFRLDVKKAILESERLKKIYPNANFSTDVFKNKNLVDHGNDWMLSKPKYLEDFLKMKETAEKTLKSNKNIKNFLEKGYLTKMDLISKNPILKNIAEESPQYTDLIYEHLKNPSKSTDEFVNDLVKQSNTFTRSMHKSLDKGEISKADFFTPKGHSMGFSGKNTIDVEGFPTSDFRGEYGANKYKIFPNAERMENIANTPLEERWSKRFPSTFPGNENINFGIGMHGSVKNDFLHNATVKRISRNRVATGISPVMSKNIQSEIIPHNYLYQPKHIVFNTEGSNNLVKGFDVEQVSDVFNPFKTSGPYGLHPGYTHGFKYGGIIEDPMGQWAHPGSVTRIPSNQITMQGVNYPVLGISDRGHTQMMYPGEDYSFRGRSVTEYPIMQDGGRYTDWKNKYGLQETSDYNLQRAFELGYVPDETGHLPSVDSETGEWLKSDTHPTRGMEMMESMLNPDVANNLRLIRNEKGKMQYVPKSKYGGEVNFTYAGENHRVYEKESPTGNGKGIEGHIMVNHPTKNKGKWDTIDLTKITNGKVKTVAQGVASTKKWHKENPEYADGGMIKRADGSYSKRGLWDNIRDNAGSGKKPTKEMLKQERKIKSKYANGGKVSNWEIIEDVPQFQKGGKVVSEIWEETTGSPWSEAKKLGLTQGGYEENLKLRSELLKNPDKFISIVENNIPVEKRTPTTNTNKPEPAPIRPQSVPTEPAQNPIKPSQFLQKNYTAQQDNTRSNVQNNEKKVVTLPVPNEVPISNEEPLTIKTPFGNLVPTNLIQKKPIVNQKLPVIKTPFDNLTPINSNLKNLIPKENPIKGFQYSSPIESTYVANSMGTYKPEKTEDSLIKKTVNKIKNSEFVQDVSDVLRDVNDFEDVKSSFVRGLGKAGILTPNTEEVKPMEVVQPKTTLPTNNKNITPHSYYQGEGIVDPKTKATMGRYVNIFSNTEGQEYIPTKNVGEWKKDKSTEYNSSQMAHYLLDMDLTTGYQHPNSKKWIEDQKKGKNIVKGSTLKEQWLPVYVNLPNGNVKVHYKTNNELTPEDKIASPLRQYKFGDLDWKSDVKSTWNKSSSAIRAKTGEETNLIKSGKNMSGYGQFGGGSFVLLSKNPTTGEVVIDEFAGSLQDVTTQAKAISKLTGQDINEIVLGYYDVGSWSVKPQAKDHKLGFKSYPKKNKNEWESYQKDGTGAGLAFPFKNGGKIKKSNWQIIEY